MTNRFCILLHDYPFWHWDLLLENGDLALCWRLLREPMRDEPIAAEELAPHRLFWFDYEGPVSNNRGGVARVSSGTYQVIATDPGFMIRLQGLEWAEIASLEVIGANRTFWRFSGV